MRSQYIHEKYLFQVRPSIIPYFGIVILLSSLAGLFAALLALTYPFLSYLLIGVIVFGVMIVILSWSSTIYTLTDQRVTYQIGIFGTKEEIIELSRIAGSELNQNILGKILNFGNIVIEGDNPDSVFTFRNIDNPKFYLDLIEKKAINAE